MKENIEEKENNSCYDCVFLISEVIKGKYYIIRKEKCEVLTIESPCFPFNKTDCKKFTPKQ